MCTATRLSLTGACGLRLGQQTAHFPPPSPCRGGTMCTATRLSLTGACGLRLGQQTAHFPPPGLCRGGTMCTATRLILTGACGLRLGLLQQGHRCLHTSPGVLSSSRFDPDSSGRPTTWDSFGIWDNRIDEPILLPPSIRYGKPIPKVSLSKVGCASHIGQRKENEDHFQVSQVNGSILYFAVFDGHGGPQAADFCHKHMETYIKDLVHEEHNLELVLTKAFLEVDKAFEMHLNASGNASLQTSGSTATVALLRDSVELVVASVGDSRALLCRRGKAQRLTVDHTPERKDEKDRIKKSGGFVTWNSLGQANVNGRLAMTRSIGDFDLKARGVIAEPETKRVTLQHVHDSFLVLTTDGINFIMNSQEICDVISQCPDPREAAQVIAEQVQQYGSEDNSTIVVVPFGAWGKQKASDASYSLSRSFVSSGRWA